ncbi:hypothetical protein HZB94_01990 [Candidatus Falkowbacteria bacterium]|nr:hypothetical protein [Candidatus Falkowbacteria bacterium]
MPNNIVKKEQTAPGVKRKKKFEPEGEKRAGEPVKEIRDEELKEQDIDRDFEETLLPLEKFKGAPEKLLGQLRKNTQKMFESAVIARDEEAAYRYLYNAQRYNLPEYRDMQESFLRFVDKLLLQGMKELGRSRHAQLQALMDTVRSERFPKPVEISPAEEFGFKEEDSPYEETGVAEKETGPTTFAHDLFEEKTDPETRNFVAELTPSLFREAINDENEGLAFLQLLNAKKYHLPEFPAMKNQLLYLIGYLLNQPDEELGEAKRARLEKMREMVEKQTMVEIFVPRQLTAEQRRRLMKEHIHALEEITPVFFEKAIKMDDIIWAYEHLKRAKELHIPEYSAMRDRFMLFSGRKMDQGIEYYEKWMQNSAHREQKTTYEEFRSRLREIIEAAGTESFRF